MAKLINIALWTLGIVGVMTVMAFSSSERKNLETSNIQVEVDFSHDSYFVNATIIEEIVRDKYYDFDSITFQEINIQLLEESLDNHPSIRKAEVYSKLDGSLRVSVLQRQAIARVQNLQSDYYIDELGDSMSLSSNFYAEVPLIKGNIEAENRRKIFQFIEVLNNDEFYNNFLGGLEVKENEEWVLYPKPGNHKVYFGKPERISGKLNKLKTYYQHLEATKLPLKEIKSLNLRFEDQVICRKY